jgi:hypothetical protein
MVNAGLIFVVNAALRTMVSERLTAAATRIDPGKSAA